MTTTEELAEKLRTGRVLTTDEGSPLQEAAARILEQEQEIERLNRAIKWEQHRYGRVGTHGPDCHTWGPAHYECLLRKYGELRGALAGLLLAHAVPSSACKERPAYEAAVAALKER